jgi:thiamine transport system ATP-binding protein
MAITTQRHLTPSSALFACGDQRAGRNRVDALAMQVALTVRGLRFRYPGMDRDLLCDITLDISRGDLIGLEGDNGAGKSTLLDLIAGDLPPDTGRIDMPEGAHLEYLPQGQYPFGRFTCEETIRYLCTLHSGRSTSLDDFLSQIPDPALALRLRAIAPRFLWQVSGGERQALNAAIMLSRHADLYLLDEPFTAMDRDVRQRFARWIAARCQGGAAVMLISHDDRDMDRLATRRVQLVDGKACVS